MRWWFALVLVGACSRIESTAGPPTAEELAKACIKYAACGGSSVGSCIVGARSAHSAVSVYRPRQLRCLAETKGDCAELLACVGITVSTCGSDAVRCDGDRLVNCTGGIEYSVDCSGGLDYLDDDTCVKDRCAAGTCNAPNTSTCDGTRIEYCQFDGVLIAEDCAVYGETCVLDANGPRCGLADAFPCTETRCAVDVLVACDGYEHRVDCPSLYGAGLCSDREDACVYGSVCGSGGFASCRGDVLTVCALGDLLDIDCTQLGLAGCSVDHCVAF